MKTLITFFTSTLLLLSGAKAQFSEYFEQNISTLSGNCWTMTGVNYTTTSGDVITGNGSGYTNPPTSSSGLRSIATPFLNMSSNSMTVTFNYKTSSKISGNATRTINIGILDKNNIFTSLQVLTMDKHTVTTVINHSATYTLPATGVYRLELRIGGATGDGNSRVIFDDLTVSASAFYGPVNHCNPTAVANNDGYSASTISPIIDTVLKNDVIPADNEIYSVSIVTAPTSGNLVIDANGIFTYTPDASFTGGIITFTYVINDNGYSPTTSNIATVTLTYPVPVILPVKLLSFTAALNGTQAEISWVVDDNTTGNYYELERSTDGKNFTTIKKIMASLTVDIREYNENDAMTLAEMFYRLKIVNNDLSILYSKVVLVKTSNNTTSTLKVVGNPVIETLTVSFNSFESTTASISIFSLGGVRVTNTSTNAIKGLNTHSIQVNQLQPGMYVVVVNGGPERQSSKFIKR